MLDLMVDSTESESVGNTQGLGLLILATLLPAARYCTPHLSQIVGRHLAWLNPFLNGWFIDAYRSFMSGKPTETEFLQVSASVSGATIGVTSPFISGIFESIADDDSNTNYDRLQDQGHGWQISIATVSRPPLSCYAKTFIVVLTLVLYAIPISCMVVLGDYSGVGSVAYVTFGLAVRIAEKLTHVSCEAGNQRVTRGLEEMKHLWLNEVGSLDAITTDYPIQSGKERQRPQPQMSLLYRPFTSPSVVLLRADNKELNSVNIEHLAHPRLSVRFDRYASVCTAVYRALLGVLLVGWLVLLETSRRSSTAYTNGYIDVTTLAVSAVGEVFMQRLVAGTVNVKKVQKRNAITAVAWLAYNSILDAPGVPKRLLQLTADENALVHALFLGKVDDALWERVPKCDREQVMCGEYSSMPPRIKNIKVQTTQYGSTDL